MSVRTGANCAFSPPANPADPRTTHMPFMQGFQRPAAAPSSYYLCALKYRVDVLIAQGDVKISRMCLFRFVH